MSDIQILFPPEDYVLYGSILKFRYQLKNNLTKKNFKTIYLNLDGLEVEDDYTNNQYVFSNISEGDHTLSGYIKTKEGKKVDNTEFTLNFKSIQKSFIPPNSNWYLIKEKLPLFIQEDYKTFTRFIEAYYEWLEKSNNPIYMNFNSEFFGDVDTTPDLFLESFRTQYLNDFPINVLNTSANIKNIVKHIKQFYSSKGTEKSIKFLFRLLYSAYTEIYYPRKYLLVASGNLWVERKTIRVRGLKTSDSLKINKSVIYQKKFTSTPLPGQSNYTISSSARIISVTPLRITEEDIFELEIDNIIGNFDLYDSQTSLTDYYEGYIGEKVYIDTIDGKEIIPVEVYMINGINDLVVTSTGLNSGDFIEIVPLSLTNNSPTGNSFSGVVDSVDSTGKPEKITINNHGYDYRGSTNTFIIRRKNSDSSTDRLSGSFKIEKIMKETGYYETVSSSPSSGGVIRDNRKYQEMSYVIKNMIDPKIYIDNIKKLVHPAGMGVFSEVLYKKNTSIKINKTFYLKTFIKPYLGNFMPYTFNSYKNLRNDFFEYGDLDYYNGNYLTDLYPNGFDPESEIPNEIYATKEHIPRPYKQLKQNVNNITFSYIPSVSDYSNINNYWVVFPNLNQINNKTDPIKNLTIEQVIKFFDGQES